MTDNIVTPGDLLEISAESESENMPITINDVFFRQGELTQTVSLKNAVEQGLLHLSAGLITRMLGSESLW